MAHELRRLIQRDVQMNFAEAKVRNLLDASPDAIVIIRINGTIESVNAQMENWFGYRREELIGQPLEVLLPERFCTKHVAHRANFSKSPVRRPMGTGLDLFARRKNGTEFPVDISIGPLVVDGERFFISTIRDISEKKRLQAEHAQAVQARENIVGMVAHDLKNPLTAILISLQLAPKLLGSTPVIQKWLQSLRSSAEQMHSLVQDILTAKITKAGAIMLDKQFHDVSKIVDCALELIEPIAARKSLHIERMSRPENMRIFCDKERTLQILSNLLGNAVKFTPEGGMIQLQVEREPEAIRFSILNTGPGIAEEDLSRVFEPYWQAKKAAKSGTGLGLSIVKSLVEAHGGKVGAQSQPGQRTQFFFTLPTT